MTQIKICGFTDPKEAAFISYPDVSYMGMVLFSRRANGIFLSKRRRPSCARQIRASKR